MTSGVWRYFHELDTILRSPHVPWACAAVYEASVVHRRFQKYRDDT